MRRPAGRAAACGPPAATGHRGSGKAARAASPSPCTSSCAPIRWRGKGLTHRLLTAGRHIVAPRGAPAALLRVRYELNLLEPGGGFGVAGGAVVAARRERAA